ncbi:corrinoid protein [Candidatus Bathyarchaeota archaeon]|nr:corrinoid protein [Candidatus Bathyarchaeota archaeon]
MPKLDEVIKEALMSFEPEKLTEAVKRNLNEGYDPLEVINALTVALGEVGSKFEKGELFLVHLVMAGETAKKVISEQLEPLLKKTRAERKMVGRVVIGTVAGDIHDIGKNIVASMLFSAGFDVIDLGKGVPIEKFINSVRECAPHLLAMSALMSTTMPVQKAVVEALKENNLRDKVKVIIGGAPVTAEWTEEIGADGYAGDAIQAVKVAKQLVEAKN